MLTSSLELRLRYRVHLRAGWERYPKVLKALKCWLKVAGVLFFPTYAEIVVLYTIFPFQNYTCIGVGMVVQSNEEVGCCIVYWEDPPHRYRQVDGNTKRAWKVRQTYIFVLFITLQFNIIITDCRPSRFSWPDAFPSTTYSLLTGRQKFQVEH